MTEDRSFYSAWSALTVGVSNLDRALAMWVEHLGFSVAAADHGDDPELARLWGLQPNDIAAQALLRCGDSRVGMLHLVQFNSPQEPVRKNANNFDLVPKNLDIYVNDLPNKVAQLRSAGVSFRTDKHSEIIASDGTQFREIHMPSDDYINVVLVEVVGEEHNYNSAGIAGIGPFVFTVPDVEAEADFFTSLLHIEKLKENIFRGPEIEKMVGLPPGTALKIFIMGSHEQDLGELEIVEYQGVDSANLYPQARPKALGVLQMSYVVDNSQPLQARLAAAQVDVTEHGRIRSLLGEGEVMSFTSPAGLKIEVYSNHQGKMLPS